MSALEAFLNHPIEMLERALHIRKQIDQLNETLKELFGPTSISLGAMQTSLTDVPKKRRGRPRKVSLEDGIESRDGLFAGMTKKKRKMSAAGRAKIAAAQRARWAKAKSSHGPLTAVAMPGTEGTTAKPARKKKRNLSPEARNRIVAAQKARRERERAGK